jgi:predicted metal-dependent hydrolase
VQLGLPFRTPEPADAVPGVPAPPPGPPGSQFYFVRHRRARRYLLRVEPDGRVRVTIPRGGSRREADAFALRHLDWIARQRARMPVLPTLTADERRALIRLAKQELPIRLMQLAAEHGLAVSRVSVRNQRSRWGSCGRDGHICLNWRLVRMPEWVRDYVMVHELMHLRRLDHSPAYWKLVARAVPEYQAARRWLRVHGREL